MLSACLLVAGFALRGWAGAIVLFCLAAVLAWLAAVSWPKLNGQGRVLRVIIVAAVAAVGVVRGLH